MRVFITKLLIFGLLFASSYMALIHLLSQSDVDEHYYKFTQEAGGLVLGISRAGEGINPDMLKRDLMPLGPDLPIVNFALNKYQSPYGEVYLRAIEKKIGNLNDGIFILSVAPGNFTAPRFFNEKEILEMDQKMSIGKIENFTNSPNYNYIVNCYSKPLYTALELKASENPVFHRNGWQEAKLESPDFTITPELMELWKDLNIREYHRILKKEKMVHYRLQCFIKTLDYLKSKGNIIIIRMPADCEIISDENEFWPDFDRKFDSIAEKYQVPFINYTKQCDQYIYYDGSHLESESANIFSRRLAQAIKPILNE